MLVITNGATVRLLTPAPLGARGIVHRTFAPRPLRDGCHVAEDGRVGWMTPVRNSALLTDASQDPPARSVDSSRRWPGGQWAVPQPEPHHWGVQHRVSTDTSTGVDADIGLAEPDHVRVGRGSGAVRRLGYVRPALSTVTPAIVDPEGANSVLVREAASRRMLALADAAAAVL